jgi:hypothetical protein
MRDELLEIFANLERSFYPLTSLILFNVPEVGQISNSTYGRL